jgi:hypothetical protein
VIAGVGWREKEVRLEKIETLEVAKQSRRRPAGEVIILIFHLASR